MKTDTIIGFCVCGILFFTAYCIFTVGLTLVKELKVEKTEGAHDAYEKLMRFKRSWAYKVPKYYLLSISFVIGLFCLGAIGKSSK